MGCYPMLHVFYYAGNGAFWDKMEGVHPTPGSILDCPPLCLQVETKLFCKLIFTNFKLISLILVASFQHD